VYGGGGAPHQVGTATRTSVVVVIPSMTRQRLRNGAVAINFYRLAAKGQDDLTPARLMEIVSSTSMAPYAQISTEALSNAVGPLSGRR
jgi:hypothetical protein